MTERPPIVFGLAIVGLSVGLSTVVATALQPGAAVPVSTPRQTGSSAQIRDLQERLLALETIAHTLQAEDPTPETAAASGAENRVAVPPASSTRLQAIEERLEQLEQRAQQASQDDLGIAQLAPPSARIDARLEQSVLRAHARAVIGSDRTSVEQKVEAHTLCRRVPDAYDAATAARLIDIGLTDAKATTRAKVWTSFDGAVCRNLPQLIDPLCRAVAMDRSPQVRAEAAETLGNFPQSPAALAALKHALEHDPDDHVRRKAQRTLKEMRSGQ